MEEEEEEKEEEKEEEEEKSILDPKWSSNSFVVSRPH